LGNKGSSWDFLGYINTTRLLTGRRRNKSAGNPSKLTGDAFIKEGKGSERNNSLK
jgi:hypothetical protein